MGDTWTRPLSADLTWQSTREEVLAAVEEAEQRDAESREFMKAYRDDDAFDWRGDPPGEREGCYWSKDGEVRINVGHPRDENPVMARQRVAGEEDQSVPGWDYGA